MKDSLLEWFQLELYGRKFAYAVEPCLEVEFNDVSPLHSVDETIEREDDYAHLWPTPD